MYVLLLKKQYIENQIWQKATEQKGYRVKPAVVEPAILHSDAFWPFLVHWGLDKPLLKIHGVLIKLRM